VRFVPTYLLGMKRNLKLQYFILKYSVRAFLYIRYVFNDSN